MNSIKGDVLDSVVISTLRIVGDSLPLSPHRLVWRTVRSSVYNSVFDSVTVNQFLIEEGINEEY